MIKKMQVAMYYSNEDVRLEEMLIPEISDDEILMKVMSSSICGSDVMFWYRRDRVPLVLGHEVSGVIEKIGKNVGGFNTGDRIFVTHHVPCNECKYCKSGNHTVCEMLRKTNFYPGGLAQYLRIPHINIEKGGVLKIPENVSFEEATFIEPLACVLRGQRIAKASKKKNIIVFGSGISGLLHIKLLKKGSDPIIAAVDVNDYRLEMAQKFGASKVVKASKYTPDIIKQIFSGRLADLIILCTGAKSAIDNAFESIERNGTVLFFAPADARPNDEVGQENIKINLPVNHLFWRNEVALVSSYGGSPDDCKEALDLISSRTINIKDMITHRLNLAETEKGFKIVSQAKESIKVIISPHD